MTHPIPDQAHLLTVEEAAECLGIGRTKTYELMMNGALASIKIGSRRLIAVRSVTAYIRDQLGQVESPASFTKDTLESLVESGEVQSITLGKYLFVSVDSLDVYLRERPEVAS
ncbi:MAG: helix-turn-helix domain-containing protein [Actinobacteria bacterium]|nr:helix-turn-helix domain-containing protein [Actinomycetota bacterium]